MQVYLSVHSYFFKYFLYQTLNLALEEPGEADLLGLVSPEV